MYKDILVDEAREREADEVTCLKEIKLSSVFFTFVQIFKFNSQFFSMRRIKEKYAKLHGKQENMDHYDGQ